MPTLVSDIESTHWSLSLENANEIVQDLEDIAQCIVLILSTSKGSVPFDPNFGFNLGELLDQPVNFVIPNGKIGILEAISEYEPRVEIDRIEHILEVSKVTFIVYCSTNLGNFAVTVPIDPQFTPTLQGGFSGGFGQGFN